jgi:hypothetical protein
VIWRDGQRNALLRLENLEYRLIACITEIPKPPPITIMKVKK